MITEVVQLRSRTESVPELLAVHAGHGKEYFAEPGCVSARLLQSTGDVTAFVYVIEWETMDAEVAATQSAAGGRFLGALQGVLAAAPEQTFLVDVDGVDSEARGIDATPGDVGAAS